MKLGVTRPQIQLRSSTWLVKMGCFIPSGLVCRLLLAYNTAIVL